LLDKYEEIASTILGKNGGNINYGFNLKTKVYEDLRQAGVIEPAGTLVSVIQNATSIVKLLLNCSAVIFP
jgi:chaperonin GroEL